jgi:hypothetical protein
MLASPTIVCAQSSGMPVIGMPIPLLVTADGVIE